MKKNWNPLILLIIFSFCLAGCSSDGITQEVGQLIHHKVIDIKSKKYLSNLENKKVGNITFYFNSKEIDKDYSDLIISELKENHNEFNEIFGPHKMEPVKIILYCDTSNTFEETEKGYVSGFYQVENQSIHLPIPKDDLGIREFKQAFLHEYTHHLLITLLNKNGLNDRDIPVWFNEGIASYIGYKYNGVSLAQIKDFEYTSFKELNTLEKWDRYLGEPHDIYLHSIHFSDWKQFIYMALFSWNSYVK